VRESFRRPQTLPLFLSLFSLGYTSTVVFRKRDYWIKRRKIKTNCGYWWVFENLVGERAVGLVVRSWTRLLEKRNKICLVGTVSAFVGATKIFMMMISTCQTLNLSLCLHLFLNGLKVSILPYTSYFLFLFFFYKKISYLFDYVSLGRELSSSFLFFWLINYGFGC
jgi:hypothetical protein